MDRPPHIMEALYIQPWEEKEVTMKEQEPEKSGEQEEGGIEASSPAGSTADEDTDEDSEPEPSPVIRRKVSFADAFGLDLVSVKEFDNAEVKDPEVSLPPEREATRPLEEFYMTCLFTVPSTPEELDQRLQAQMVELESIELLPGTTTIRGIIRVVNLCYCKTVHARMSLDRWQSYFDLLAEYVPGSSDRKTDRFAFQYALVPPFEKEGTRVEICLRYDTSVGTFWANNKGMNHVLFCHQKGHANEHGPQTQEESGGYRSKRSCLKASRRGSAEEKTRETSYTSPVVAEAEASDKAEEANRETIDRAEIQSLLRCKERKLLVDSIKSRRRATRLARVQDYLTQRIQHVPKAYSHDSVSSHEIPQPLPTPRDDSASFLHKHQKKLSNESSRVLTYHEIPLLTLDWNVNKSHQLGTPEMDDVWTGRAKMSLTKVENIDDTPSVNDMWEMFCNGTDDTADKEISVRDDWQQFLNGSSCAGYSGVPESEWLQTAASVLPSNDKESKTQYAGRSQEHDYQGGSDTPTTSHDHISVSCQLLSDICKTSLDNVALNNADHKPAQSCVSSPTHDNTVTRDASQRSDMNLVKDTLQEFSPGGATPVSEGNVESSTECHKHVMWERVRERIIEGAEGIGGDDLVTSSGELETTDMAATAECLNASAVDRISDGARLDEGLSSSREGQETGTKHNMMDDRLAFRETIRQDTKNGERFVFSTSRQGVDEAILNTCMENKASAGEEIFRPQKTEECEISQRYADEKQREEFRLNRNSEKPLQQNESDEDETRPAQSHVDEFGANQSCDDDFKQSQIMTSKLEREESENKDVASNKEDLEVFKKTAVAPSYSTTSKEETKRVLGAEAGIMQPLNEEAWQHNAKDLQLNSSWQRGNMTVISDAHDEQSRPIQADEEIHSQKKEEDSKLTHIQDNVDLKSEVGEHQSEEGKCFSWDEIIEKQQDINPSAQTRPTVESREMIKVLLSEHDTSRPFPSDKCNPTPLEETKMGWSYSHDDTKGQKEDVGHGISPDKVIAKEDVAKKDTSTELQRQPKTLERTEEDMSHRDKDERVSIGELKIEALGELMGNVGISRGERKNVPAQLKEQELSAEVESSPHVECEKLSEGTKDPISAENTAALEMMELGLEKMFIERFGDDLVKGIWEEVFNLKAQVSNRDLNTVGGRADKLADVPDNTRDCHPFEKDLNDAFESGVFALTENSSLCQGLEQTLAVKSNEFSPKERSQSVILTEQTHFLSELHRDSHSCAHPSQDPESILAAQSDQSNYPQIKERSVTHQETGRQTEERVVAHIESFDPSDRRCYKPPRSSSEKLKESVWWSMLYILVHVTRLLICTLLVAGFFYIVFLCDFPAFFALYLFSLGWWFYKWRRHRVTTNKAIVE